MWIKFSNRKELTDILSENGAEMAFECHYSNSLSIDPPLGDNFYLIWDSNPKEYKCLPIVILVAEDRLRDFLAWVSTYFPNFRPFTAYFRVMEFNSATKLKATIDFPSLDSLETACIGIILGEALTLSSDFDKRLLLPVVCSSTLSYCLARSLALGATNEDIDIICDKWLLARRITDQPVRNLEIITVKYIWKIIEFLKNGMNRNREISEISKYIIDACFELKHHGRISNNLWAILTHNQDELKIAQDKMTLSREERVLFFNKILTSETLSIIKDYNIHSFILGYLVSLIGPGSMNHIDLIIPNNSKMPGIILWYGLCAGLSIKNEILSCFNVLGRRLLRELIKPDSLLRTPSSDISIPELQILIEGKDKAIEFRAFSSRYIVVELIPYVYSYLTWPKHEIIHQKQLFTNQPLLLKLRSFIEEALGLEKLLSNSEEKTQNISPYKRTRKRIKER